jgi:hypothetical protein
MAAASPPAIPAGAWHVQIDTSGQPPVTLDPLYTRLAGEGVVIPEIREPGGTPPSGVA